MPASYRVSETQRQRDGVRTEARCKNKVPKVAKAEEMYKNCGDTFIFYVTYVSRCVCRNACSSHRVYKVTLLFL